MKLEWQKIMMTPIQLFYWNLFFMILNMALVIYLPYKFFFFSSFPRVTQSEIIIASILVFLEGIQIMVKLQTSSDMLGTSLENKKMIQRNYLIKEFPLDILSALAILSICLPDNWTPTIRLLIYCKLPSIFKYDRHITIAIRSLFFNFWYILIKVVFLYLVYANMTAGTFFKIDYDYYLQQGYYVDNGMIWLLDSQAMLDIIDWSAPVHYLYSIYWAAITASCTGYGDITPLNPQQVLITIFVFVPNVLLFGFLIDNINFKFNELNQRKQVIREQQIIVLRILRDAQVSKKTFYQFKHHIQKMVDEQINNKQNIMESLSTNLQMELMKQLFSQSLRKFNDLSKDDLLVIKSNIYEANFFQNQIIYPNNNYYFVTEGQGKIFLKGLDCCSYQQGIAQINNFSIRSCLNIYSFLSRRINTFIKYKTSAYSRMYCIDQPPNLKSLRQKSKQIMIDKQYAKYGIECTVCYSTSHPTVQCSYLTYTPEMKLNSRTLDKRRIGDWNRRQFQTRNQRQNQILRSLYGFKYIRFQQTYFKNQE